MVFNLVREIMLGKRLMEHIYMISRKSGTFSLIEEFKNSGLVMILHCLNSFQHNNNMIFSLLYVLLRENHKINVL